MTIERSLAAEPITYIAENEAADRTHEETRGENAKRAQERGQSIFSGQELPGDYGSEKTE